MKKIFPGVQRLTRPKLIIGMLILVALLGVVAWRFYDNSQRSNATATEIDRSIDRQLADQVSGRSLAEKAIGNDTPQQSATTPRKAI